MQQFKKIIQTYPVFAYLLPVFFVLHGFIENYFAVPVKDALLLTLFYTGVTLVFIFLFWFFYKSFKKASLIAFCLMAYHFFYGSVIDKLRSWVPGSFISRYSFVLPLSLLFFITLIISIKKRKASFTTVTYYLNVLLLIFLLIDIFSLSSRIITYKNKTGQLPEGTTALNPGFPKPDIYFILADEYAGNTELKDIFHFDDSSFLNELSHTGFHIIPESHSNYNYTPFSLASTLNMSYLQLTGDQRGKTDLAYCYETINHNQAFRFFETNGYKLYNYSVFDFDGQPSPTYETFLPTKTRLITAQTFISRVIKELWFHTAEGELKINSSFKKLTYSALHNNEGIYKRTWDIVSEKTDHPKLVYTHLMMPHYPYYYNKDGQPLPFEQLVEGQQGNKENYISYLQYSNKKLLELVHHILRESSNPPVIILMGDHGFRHFPEPVQEKYYFINLSSIYLPAKNYSLFTDSLTNVNFFRTLLNSSFDQHLPLLKDSTSYLKD